MQAGLWYSAKVGALADLTIGSAVLSAQASPLVIGVQTEATAIDPHNHVGVGDNQVRIHLFDSLVAMNATQNIEPALAESWTLTNGVTWTFKLRKGVEFS